MLLYIKRYRVIDLVLSVLRILRQDLGELVDSIEPVEL
jgi:hypothetical protein